MLYGIKDASTAGIGIVYDREKVTETVPSLDKCAQLSLFYSKRLDEGTRIIEARRVGPVFRIASGLYLRRYRIQNV